MKEYDFLTTPIVDIVNNIIIDAVNLNASDIHFDCSEKFLKIRVRVDGELRDYSIIDNKYKRNLITRIKLLSGMNITESRLPQDGAIKGNIGGKDLDMRVSCLPTIFGEKVVIRILDYTMSLKGIDSLGFTKENYELILKMLANPNGIILVTGATGSGKSTTTYAMLQRLNSEETNIITVEDPVEMNVEGINQVQVNSEIGLDFASVLRSILRQDPNVILIGEIRDTETAQIAVRSSITGHLVLSTLHTNNALTSIERLLDMNVERYLLSASLKGIISQNLAKKLCPKCKKKRPTTEAEKRLFKKQLNMDVEEIYEHGTCPECRNGFKGRIAIHEVLYLNDEIRDAINDSMKRSKLRELIYGRGVKTMLQDGLIKVVEGTTSLDEILRIIEAEGDNSIYSNDDEVNEEEIKEETHDTPVNDNIFDKVRLEPSETLSPNVVSSSNEVLYSNDVTKDNEEILESMSVNNINPFNNNMDNTINPVSINSNFVEPIVNTPAKDIGNINNYVKPINENINNGVDKYSKENISNNNVNDLIDSILSKKDDLSNTLNYPKVVTADALLEKENDLENTQDIFASLWNDDKQSNNSDYITMKDVMPTSNVNQDIDIKPNAQNRNTYTDDLLNLINSNLNGN